MSKIVEQNPHQSDEGRESWIDNTRRDWGGRGPRTLKKNGRGRQSHPGASMAMRR